MNLSPATPECLNHSLFNLNHFEIEPTAFLNKKKERRKMNRRKVRNGDG
jgi:hypothetical protein